MGHLRGAAGFARVVAIAALAPLDADFEALHVEAVKLGQGLLGRLLGVVLNERVRSLLKVDARSDLWSWSGRVMSPSPYNLKGVLTWRLMSQRPNLWNSSSSSNDLTCLEMFPTNKLMVSLFSVARVCSSLGPAEKASINN